MFLRWPFIHWRKFEKEISVAYFWLQKSPLRALILSIWSLKVNQMIKPAGNDELRILCLILFLKVWHSRRLRWQKNWFVPAEAKGLTMVSRCFTEAQRPSNSGSKTVSDQGETLSGTMLLGGPRHWSIRVLSDWFLPSSVPVTGGGTWRTTVPTNENETFICVL